MSILFTFKATSPIFPFLPENLGGLQIVLR